MKPLYDSSKIDSLIEQRANAIINYQYEPDDNIFIPDKHAQDWIDNLSSGIDYIIPFDCIARDIQQWILSTSRYPQPAIAYAATMIILSYLFGREMAYGNIKANLMFICLAESGEGKDWPFKAIKKLIATLGYENGIHARMASGAALFSALSEYPSLIFHIDEFGNYLNSISNKNANQYSREIVDIMTEAYTCADTELVGKKTKTEDAIRILEPNLCVFGLSTERQVFDSLRTSDLANGSLARYSILFGVSGLLPRRIDSDNAPRQVLIDKLKEQIEKHKNSLFLSSRQLNIEQEYDDAKFKIETDIKIKSNRLRSDGAKSAFIPIYNRIAVRCIQQAMLIDRCQDIDVLHWLLKLELASVDIFAKKFLHIGADNENERQSKFLQAKIKESGKNGITAREITRLTQQIKVYDRQKMLSELVESGLVFADKKNNGSQRPTTKYFWIK